MNQPSKFISPNNREVLYAQSSITGKSEYLTSTNHVLDSSATISGEPIPATGLSDAIAVQIVDGSGNQITSFGGGTQYTDGGVPPTHPVGGTIEWSDGSNWQTVSTAKPLPVTATFSPSGTQDTNLKQINGNTTLVGNGVTGTGSQRVTIASDNTAFSVNATLSAETTKVIGTVNQGTSPWVVSNGGTFATQVTANPLVSAPLVGQAKIATGGTAVRLNGGTSQPLTNGIIVSAVAGNSGPISVGISSVNNTQDGTGNGYLLAAGASISFAVNNTNEIYINGATGDYVSWAGS